MGPIGQKHIGKGASILVEAVRLERDLFAKDQLLGGLLGFLSVGLAFAEQSPRRSA